MSNNHSRQPPLKLWGWIVGVAAILALCIRSLFKRERP